VFYVDLVNKPGWRSVIAMKPRELFAMPELELEDSIDVGIQGISDLLDGQEDLTNWIRPDKEGTTGDVSVIAQVQAEAADEPDHVALLDDDEDDTYIEDRVVTPIVSRVESQDDDFFYFISYTILFVCEQAIYFYDIGCILVHLLIILVVAPVVFCYFLFGVSKKNLFRSWNHNKTLNKYRIHILYVEIKCFFEPHFVKIKLVKNPFKTHTSC